MSDVILHKGLDWWLPGWHDYSSLEGAGQKYNYRRLSGKSAARCAARDTARDSARDTARDTARDSARDSARDTARDTVR